MRRTLPLIVVLLAALVLPSFADAAIFTVDRSGEAIAPGQCSDLVPADCSLREAVAFAEALPDADVVSVAGLASVSYGIEVTYGGPGALTIVGQTSNFTHIDVFHDHAFRVLAGAGPVRLQGLWINRTDSLDVTDRSSLVVESGSRVETSFVVFGYESSRASGGALVDVRPPTGTRGHVMLADSSTSAGSPGGTAIAIDHSDLVLRGSEALGTGPGSGIVATGGSTIRLVATRAASATGTPVELGDGALTLRHATLTTKGAGLLVTSSAGASVNTGASLLTGGSSCFGTVPVTSVGFNLTNHAPIDCAGLTAPGDATSLPSPGVTAIDALAACYDDGAGGTIGSDLTSIRPSDGNGDGVTECDVGAREHGSQGSLAWSPSAADVHVGETIETRVLIERRYRPIGHRFTLTIAVPPQLALAHVKPGEGVSCSSGAPLICTVADAQPSLVTDHATAVDLVLTAVATASVQLVAQGRDEITDAIDPVGSTSIVSAWSSGPFGVHVTAAPPPPLVAPTVKRAIPNAYAGCTVLGTAGRDHLTGTSHGDVICGLGGNDVIDGRGGADHIIAGDGNDVVDGGTGNDWIEGGAGRDRLRGGPGADLLSGGRGADRIEGGPGSDRLGGGLGHDSIDGGSGSDRVTELSGDRARHIEHGLPKHRRRRR